MCSTHFLDLFCGGGRFSLGLGTRVGAPVLGVDVWDVAFNAYKLNVGDSQCVDIKNFDGTPYKHKVDAVIGSPPCQSFSAADVHTRTLDTSLCDQFMRIVQEIEPTYWVMENVPALMDCYAAPHKRVFQMAHYGLLQSRRRAFLSNIRLLLEPLKQKLLNESHITKIKEFRPTSLRDPYPTLTCRYNSFTKITPSIQMKEKYHVMNHIEALQLQTFPFFYQFPENAMQRDIELLLGNAVPPLFAFQIANSLMEKESFPGVPKKRGSTLDKFMK